MVQFFLDGGFLMVPVLLAGFALTGASTLQALRPVPERWKTVTWLHVAVASLGLLGFVHALLTTVRAALTSSEVADRFTILLAGSAESANNLVLMLFFLVVGATACAVGAMRGTPRT